jgi:hypothetical protein
VRTVRLPSDHFIFLLKDDISARLNKCHPKASDGYKNGQQLPPTPSPQLSPQGPLSPQLPRSSSSAQLTTDELVNNRDKDRDTFPSHQHSPTTSASTTIASETGKTGGTNGGCVQKTKATNAPAKAAPGGKRKRKCKASSEEVPPAEDEQKQKKRLKK